jgi:SRSO17 transposase
VGEDEADAERRRRCGVLTAVIFKTKPLLGWEMIQAVQRAGTRWARWVACDEAFGRAPTLLDHIASRGLWDCAEVPHDMQGWQQRPATAVPAWGGRGRQPTRARVVAGAPAPQTVVMVAEVAALRVIAMREGLPAPAVWLVLRRNLVTGELKTYLCNAPADTPLATLVRLSGMRWPIETCFEDGTQYLGMGDYEVRGWHRHMTLCILAHFFLVRLCLR